MSENYAEIQQKTRCGYCRNPMSMSSEVNDSNFIDTGYKWRDRPVYSLLCNDCLSKEERTKEFITGIDKETLDEINMYQLTEAAAAAAPAPEPETKATES